MRTAEFRCSSFPVRPHRGHDEHERSQRRCRRISGEQAHTLPRCAGYFERLHTLEACRDEADRLVEELGVVRTGHEPPTIMKQTGHKSVESLLNYARENNIHHRNAATTVGI